ncbi:hypothetical protein LOC67_07475 [Stieleria sp. JC731]|uniref:hypothetical protein n=1 Tax=Pirellulaceae TaxID=2691357 RepID=UPI001E35BB2E|nr:hypothetical protein [Stieleria sp. JC731]MCC9600396.1 hypothetical protein [Stieleria sp. JC731]
MNRFQPFFIATAILLSAGWCSCQLTAAPPLPPLESVDSASRAKWLMEGPVVDSETGRPIAAFTVIPGSISTDDDGKATIRWRDNLKREMGDGLLQWPRTSGFSVMRFKIVAEGYRPAISHIVRRGGPHTRTRVKLVKAEPID